MRGYARSWNDRIYTWKFAIHISVIVQRRIRAYLAAAYVCQTLVTRYIRAWRVLLVQRRFEEWILIASLLQFEKTFYYYFLTVNPCIWLAGYDARIRHSCIQMVRFNFFCLWSFPVTSKMDLPFSPLPIKFYVVQDGLRPPCDLVIFLKLLPCYSVVIPKDDLTFLASISFYRFCILNPASNLILPGQSCKGG